MSGKPPVSVTRSYRSRAVSLRVKLKCHSFGGNNAAANIDGSVDLTVSEARDLVNSLLAHAAEADAIAQGKAEKETRRQVWWDREIAAGRIKAMAWRA